MGVVEKGFKKMCCRFDQGDVRERYNQSRSDVVFNNLIDCTSRVVFDRQISNRAYSLSNLEIVGHIDFNTRSRRAEIYVLPALVFVDHHHHQNQTAHRGRDERTGYNQYPSRERDPRQYDWQRSPDERIGNRWETQHSYHQNHREAHDQRYRDWYQNQREQQRYERRFEHPPYNHEHEPNRPSLENHQRHRRTDSKRENERVGRSSESLERDNSTDSVAKIARIIEQLEGGKLAINWNDNGYGLSFGRFQANQKVGDLPELLKRMHRQDPDKFEQVFGPYANKLLSEKYVRSVSISRNSDLGRRFQDAVDEKSFQQAALGFLQDKVEHAAKVAKKYGVTSEAGVCLFADLINQCGEQGSKKYFAKAKAAMSEEQKIDAIEQSSAQGNKWRRSRNPQLAQKIDKFGLSDRTGSFEA